MTFEQQLMLGIIMAVIALVSSAIGATIQYVFDRRRQEAQLAHDREMYERKLQDQRAEFEKEKRTEVLSLYGQLLGYTMSDTRNREEMADKVGEIVDIIEKIEDRQSLSIISGAYQAFFKRVVGTKSPDNEGQKGQLD